MQKCHWDGCSGCSCSINKELNTDVDPYCCSRLASIIEPEQGGGRKQEAQLTFSTMWDCQQNCGQMLNGFGIISKTNITLVSPSIYILPRESNWICCGVPSPNCSFLSSGKPAHHSIPIYQYIWILLQLYSHTSLDTNITQSLFLLKHFINVFFCWTWSYICTFLITFEAWRI